MLKVICQYVQLFYCNEINWMIRQTRQLGKSRLCRKVNLPVYRIETVAKKSLFEQIRLNLLEHHYIQLDIKPLPNICRDQL